MNQLKSNKYIQRALQELGFRWDIKEECTIQSINDNLQEHKDSIITNKGIIEDCKIQIETANNQIICLEQLLKQIKIEEYKELNKGKNLEFL